MPATSNVLGRVAHRCTHPRQHASRPSIQIVYEFEEASALLLPPTTQRIVDLHIRRQLIRSCLR